MSLVEAVSVLARQRAVELQVRGAALAGPIPRGREQLRSDPLRAALGMHGEILHPGPIPEANGVQVQVGRADADQLTVITLNKQDSGIVGIDRLSQGHGGTFGIPLTRLGPRRREQPLVRRQKALLLAWPGRANLGLHAEGG